MPDNDRLTDDVPADAPPDQTRRWSLVGPGIVAAATAVRGTLSGLCQPTYVLDIPGGHGKAPLASPSLREDGEAYEVRDRGADARGARPRHRARRHRRRCR